MFISTNDALLYTVEFGVGPRTLLAHGGWTGSWELWSGPFITLSKTWRAIAYDHRGAGATLAADESITLENMVADILAVMDRLSIDRCVLAGESSGVAVVLSAALRHPERFTGLVLVDGLYYRKDQPGADPFLASLQADFPRTVEQFVDACVLATEPNSLPIRRWGRQILNRASQNAAIRLVEWLHGLDLRPLVSQIALPTLIIHGEADVIVPLSDSLWLAAQIPNSRLHVIHGAGHVPTVTYPDEVAGAINDFFS